MFYYAKPVEHEGLTAILKHDPYAVEAEIRQPRRVIVSCSQFFVNDVEFRGGATVNLLSDGTTSVTDVGVWRKEPIKRSTKKQDEIYDDAKQLFIGYVDAARPQCVSMLCDPAYVARCANYHGVAHAMLEKLVTDHLKNIAQIRKRVNDQWFEVGGASTASMGNMELEATKSQQAIASTAEAIEAFAGPFVTVYALIHELLGGEGSAFPNDADGQPFRLNTRY